MPEYEGITPIVFISVVRDYDMYQRCVAGNRYMKPHTLHAIDNRLQNLHVSVHYNRFLDGYDYGTAAWFVFCHEDFELLEDLEPYLALADKACLYGPIGAWTERRIIIRYTWHRVGQIVESKKDGSAVRIIGNPAPMGTPVETFDCQCLIMHSDLIRHTGLRFDPELSFDLYVEDFCIQGKERHDLPSRILPVSCRHRSTAVASDRYYRQEAYLRKKYPRCCYTGILSYNLGTPSPLRQWNTCVKRGVQRLMLKFLACRARNE